MGFKDKDLHTRYHDAIVIELAKEENFKKFALRFLPKSKQESLQIMYLYENDVVIAASWDTNHCQKYEFGCGCSVRTPAHYEEGNVRSGNWTCKKSEDYHEMIMKIFKKMQLFGSETIKQVVDFTTGEYKEGFRTEFEPNGVEEITYEINEISDITIEHHLNNRYKQFGFVDDSGFVTLSEKHVLKLRHKDIEIKNGRLTKYFVFFEVKTGHDTLASITREIEYYKSAIKNIGIADGYSEIKSIPIVVSREKPPEHIKQWNHISLDEMPVNESDYLETSNKTKSGLDEWS